MDPKVGGVELGHQPESVPIKDSHLAVVPDNELELAKLLQRPVDMDGCQPEAVGEIRLGHGEIKTLLVGQIDSAQASVEFAKQMGHPRQGVLSSQPVKPLSLDGPVDGDLQKKKATEAGVGLGHLHEPIM